MRYNGGGLRRGWMLLLRKAHTSCHLVSASLLVFILLLFCYRAGEARFTTPLPLYAGLHLPHHRPLLEERPYSALQL